MKPMPTRPVLRGPGPEVPLPERPMISNLLLHNMNNEFILRHEITNMLLTLADEQHDLTRSDFQGRAEIVANNIIILLGQTPAFGRRRTAPLQLTDKEIREIAAIKVVRQM